MSPIVALAESIKGLPESELADTLNMAKTYQGTVKSLPFDAKTIAVLEEYFERAVELIEHEIGTRNNQKGENNV